MLSLTRKSDYALVALTYLGHQARAGGVPGGMMEETSLRSSGESSGGASGGASGEISGGGGEGESISARRIASRFRLPLPLLMNILKSLAHAGLVVSSRGPQGGYMLARPPETISVLDVVMAIEGPVRLTLCNGEDASVSGDGGCTASGCCLIKHPIRQLNRRLEAFLGAVTLLDLMQPADLPEPQNAVPQR